jgi:hypothetical protein
MYFQRRVRTKTLAPTSKTPIPIYDSSVPKMALPVSVYPLEYPGYDSQASQGDNHANDYSHWGASFQARWPGKLFGLN